MSNIETSPFPEALEHAVLLTAAQMQAAERAAMDAGAVTGAELMERAGQGVVRGAFDLWPELAVAPGRALVLCGPGNNGGDGFVIARLLLQQGWRVSLFLLGQDEALPTDARRNHDLWRDAGGQVTALQVLAEGAGMPDGPPDLVVDALFGTGLTRPLEAGIESALDRLRDAAEGALPRVVAVDLPSGVCSDSGRPLGAPLAADLTVTFHRPKLGHVLDQGPSLCGALKVADIGLDPKVALPGHPARAARPSPRLLDKRAGHKFDHGHVLVLTGAAGRTGAARMAARAALRAGAGLVTLGVHPGAQDEVAGHITAEMMVQIGDDRALARVLEDARIGAICLGPGLGTERRGATLVAGALKDGRPVLLDADALTLASKDHALFSLLHRACLLTPHAGEFARLFPDIADPLHRPALSGPAFSRVDAVRRAAARAGCTVLLKGPDSVISDQEGHCVVHAAAYGREAPWLATAGAGDVLSGIAGALQARGARPLAAAENAAWLHAEAARRHGPGLIATDLPDALPGVFRRLGL